MYLSQDVTEEAASGESGAAASSASKAYDEPKLGWSRKERSIDMPDRFALKRGARKNFTCPKEFLEAKPEKNSRSILFVTMVVTLPALTDSIPERKRRELAGEVTSELQVVNRAPGPK